MIILYIAFYIASYFLARSGQYVLSGLLLIIAALGLYIRDYRRTGNIINLRGLFSLSFVGGEGISCFKFSKLQVDWDIKTWIAFFIGFLSFYLIYEFMLRKCSKAPKKSTRTINKDRFFVAIMVLTAASLLSFIIEASVLKYIPLFVYGVPHAYSEFHLFGLHYITTSCILVPAFCVVWFRRCRDTSGKDTKEKTKTVFIVIAAVIGLMIPILCVSRFQLMFALALAVFTYITLEEKTSWKWIAIAAAIAIPGYIILTISRSHDAEYLMSIFEMKSDLPLLISHPYIYVANNYDNFNALVTLLPKHSYGLRILNPVITLTGLKYMRPELVLWPLYITKPELATLTIFYDFYYDFGLIGMLLGGCAMGLLAFAVERVARAGKDSMAAVIYSQFAVYFGLAFFTTWFSNPATWVYLAISVIIYFISTEDANVSSRI